MPFRNTDDAYGTVARLLHWIIVVLIILQFVSVSIAEDLPNGIEKLKIMANHKSFGMLILMLAVVRLGWRLANPVPAPPAAIPGWQRLAASGTHWLLYALLFAQPITGWITSTTRNFPVSFFNLFQFPDLIGPNDRLHELFEETHHFLARTILVIAILHATAALYHHFWLKDDVLRRMLPFGRPGGTRT
jgi:cytochrome b561